MAMAMKEGPGPPGPAGPGPLFLGTRKLGQTRPASPRQWLQFCSVVPSVPCRAQDSSAQVGNHVIEAAKAKLELLPWDVKQLANQLGGIAKGMANGLKVLPRMVSTRHVLVQ